MVWTKETGAESGWSDISGLGIPPIELILDIMFDGYYTGVHIMTEGYYPSEPVQFTDSVWSTNLDSGVIEWQL